MCMRWEVDRGGGWMKDRREEKENVDRRDISHFPHFPIFPIFITPVILVATTTILL